MEPPLSEDERYRLLSAWCDGSISEAEAERLDKLVCTDPEFRGFFRAFMNLHALLAAEVHVFPAQLPTEPPGRFDADEVGRDTVGDIAETLTAGENGHELMRRPRRAPGSWRWWAGIAAAAILVAGLVTLLLWTRGRREAPTVTVPPPIATPKAVPADGLAIVVQLAGVQWEPGGERTPTEGDVLPACHLVPRSGRLTLALLSGVMLTLQGPADLELISADQVMCHRGKIQIRVPSGVQGFVLSAPGSDVADLGTEFGLNVGADGKTRVMVFEGRAEASVIGAAGSAQRNRSVPELRAVEIDPLGFQIRDVEARPEEFIGHSELTVAPLALAPSYRGAVLAARPWGYWRFETMGGGTVPNEVAGRPPLRATGPVRLAGSGNRSIAFGAGEAEQYLMLDGPWAPPREPGYAVELWFAPERIGVAALAGLYEPRGETSYAHIFLLELTARESERLLLRRPSVRYLHRWPPGWQGGDNLLFNYYVPYRWHHVVAQTAEDRMELYLNGTPLPPLSVRPDRGTAACRFLVGTFIPLPKQPRTWEVRPFVGQIDEIALYDHPLSVEEIRRHFTLGFTGARPSEP